MNSIYGNCNIGKGYGHLKSVIFHEMYHIFMGAGEGSACSSDINIRTFCCNVIKTSLTQCDKDAVRNAYNPEHTVTVKNSFGSGGDVKVDGTTYTNISAAGKIFDDWRTTSFPHSLEAIDKQVPENGIQYWRRNYKWEKDGGYYSGNRSISIQASDAEYVAWFRKEYNIVFQNNFIGVGNSGIIKVNYVNYNSPKTTQALETYSIVGAPVNQAINGIQYTFTHWNDGNTYFYRTFHPQDHSTYTAYYSGKPLSSYLDVDCNDVVGQPVILSWNDHPNIYVTQYQVWRKVKHNGVMGGATLLTTRNRGNTTYTDWEYQITRGYTHDLLYYDVRPYYSLENSYADPEWLAVYGKIMPKKSDSAAVLTGENLSMFTVSCYPNPFNPTTRIRVINPAVGNLNICIYNLLGEEIKQIVNQVKPKGIYEFIWNGTNSENIQVNSGIYIVNIRTNSEVISEKILLLK